MVHIWVHKFLFYDKSGVESMKIGKSTKYKMYWDTENRFVIIKLVNTSQYRIDNSADKNGNITHIISWYSETN